MFKGVRDGLDAGSCAQLSEGAGAAGSMKEVNANTTLASLSDPDGDQGNSDLGKDAEN